MLKLLVVAPLVTSLVGAVGMAVQHFGARDDSGPAHAADPSFGMSVAEMYALDEEHPRAPIVLPTRLPSDYGWAGLGEEQGDGREVWARSSQFTSVNGGPVVELCAKPIRQVKGCEQDDDPFVVREADGLRIFISLSSQSDVKVPTSRSFWERVDLTTDYNRVRWLGK